MYVYIRQSIRSLLSKLFNCNYISSMTETESTSVYEPSCPFTSDCQVRTFNSLKAALKSFPTEVLQLLIEYSETLCIHCQDNEKAGDTWHTFDDNTTLCESCVKKLCQCRVCTEIVIKPNGLEKCGMCRRPSCDECVVQFRSQRYCISCFGGNFGLRCFRL